MDPREALWLRAHIQKRQQYRRVAGHLALDTKETEPGDRTILDRP